MCIIVLLNRVVAFASLFFRLQSVFSLFGLCPTENNRNISGVDLKQKDMQTEQNRTKQKRNQQHQPTSVFGNSQLLNLRLLIFYFFFLLFLFASSDNFMTFFLYSKRRNDYKDFKIVFKKGLKTLHDCRKKFKKLVKKKKKTT